MAEGRGNFLNYQLDLTDPYFPPTHLNEFPLKLNLSSREN